MTFAKPEISKSPVLLSSQETRHVKKCAEVR